jgi:Ran GTPase-activating protein (RanGAP) involved in mRNA processing and transport
MPPQAKTLQFLDLSQNSLDKRSIEYIANALPRAPEPGLSSLRMDDCFLKPQALEALGMSIDESPLAPPLNAVQHIRYEHHRCETYLCGTIASMLPALLRSR